MTVHITLVAHFEWTDDAGVFTWWADSPENPGFYAAAPSLGELQREAESAISWANAAADVEVQWAYDHVPEWAAAHLEDVRMSGGEVGILASGYQVISKTALAFGYGAKPELRFGRDDRNFTLSR